MDNSILKANAKNNLSKNHWLCVAVAFFMGLGASSGLSFNFDFDFVSSASGDGSPDFAFSLPYEDIFENIFPFFSAFIVVYIIAILLISLLKILVFNIFTVGGSRFFLKLRKSQPVQFTEIFQNFRDKTYLSIAKATFLRDLYIFLFSLLLIIPGIIKSLEYSAVNYILAVRPDMAPKDALQLSKKLMDGHKGELFLLQLSFIGWQLLSAFTCGLLLLLYVNPYMQATYTEFFAYVRESAIREGRISPFDIPDYEQYVAPAPSTPFYSTSYDMNTYPGGFNASQPFTLQENVPTSPNSTQQSTGYTQSTTESQETPVSDAPTDESTQNVDTDSTNTPEN